MVGLKMLVVYRKKHTHVLKTFFSRKTFFFCFCVAKPFSFNWISFGITSILILHYIHTDFVLVAIIESCLMQFELNFNFFAIFDWFLNSTTLCFIFINLTATLFKLLFLNSRLYKRLMIINTSILFMIKGL